MRLSQSLGFNNHAFKVNNLEAGWLFDPWKNLKIYPSWSICKGSYHVSISHPPSQARAMRSLECPPLIMWSRTRKFQGRKTNKKKKSWFNTATRESTASEVLYLETILSSKLNLGGPHAMFQPVIPLGVGTTRMGPGADSWESANFLSRLYMAHRVGKIFCSGSDLIYPSCCSTTSRTPLMADLSHSNGVVWVNPGDLPTEGSNTAKTAWSSAYLSEYGNFYTTKSPVLTGCP